MNNPSGIRLTQMFKKFFKSKKIFLLPLIAPILIVLWDFLNYRKFPGDCSGGIFDIDNYVPCESYFEYIKEGFLGSVMIFFALIFFVVALLAMSSLFFFLNEKKKLGIVFLTLFLLSLIFIYLFWYGI